MSDTLSPPVVVLFADLLDALRRQGFAIGIDLAEAVAQCDLELKAQPKSFALHTLEPQQVPRHDRTRWMVDETLAFLKKHDGQPCFVNLWFDDTHTPWVPAKAETGKPRKNLAAVIAELDKRPWRCAAPSRARWRT